MLKKLDGYKTYIAAAILVITEGIKAVWPEYANICDEIQVVAGALGVGFLRAGVKKASGPVNG